MGGISIWHWLIVGVIGLPIWFVPSIVALARKHAHLPWIILVNVLTGWTGVGWIATLIWAAVGRSKEDRFNLPGRFG